MANKKDQENISDSFESTVSRLESIIDAMENQEPGLQASLDAFEEGIALINRAQKVLASAEQKVNVLIEKNSAPVAQKQDSEAIE